MKKFINWMNDKFAPAMNKITRNVWVSAIQDSIMGAIPLILVGSLITMISILNVYFPSMPDLSPISSFSFGLMSIFIVFLTPYFIMEKQKKNDRKLISALTGVALFLMLLKPNIADGNISFSFERLGANGMFVALLVGLIVGIAMYFSSKMSLFKDSSSLPDFIIVWFDTIIPISILLILGWLFTFQLHFDLYAAILKIFEPLSYIGQSFGGFVLGTFICVFLYSFGISPWSLYPILFPIWVAGVDANAQNIAKGLSANNIHTFETLMGWVWIGGMGTTLPLVLLMLFAAKSKRLKAVGKVTIVPAIFNINEPTVFGAPIVFNPILMVPMWLNGLIIPSITYIFLNIGMVTIPSKVMQLWYLPVGISTYLVNFDFKGILLLFVNIFVSLMIWYPFFKVYDIQETKKDLIEER
ncbi:PTS system, cellobiose-specific IIC component [Clostridium cavendishii DSM 21758]|uniref:Permease IIC component n=1 Tax=Clostridium cavendishii DSM 21758 TaxID=1121302 RepID=A0A1M6MHA6_9CLOT|nr:PTS transporter subunit EIIC [Clostridium cavendishii]SHJ82710.1 PTS system, cellobiose-specific IIC component [Clostridium cavendishii DSM 21758]